MDNKEIQEAIDNIRELKEIITSKQKLLTPMILSKDFINMLLSASILLLITTIITATGYINNSSFWDFPIYLKAIIMLSLLANFIQVLIRKLKAFNENTKISIATTIGEIFSVDIIVSLFLAIFFCVIFATITKLNWIYLPTITIAYGSLIISMADKVGIIEFKYIGYITIFIGIISMLFLQVPLLILGFSMYTIILFSYFVVLNISRRNKV